MPQGYKIIHAQRTGNVILMEIEFTDISLAWSRKFTGRVFASIVFNETTRTWHITNMFDEKGHNMTDLQYINGLHIKEINDWIAEHPEDVIEFPDFNKIQESKEPKKAGWLDKMKGMFLGMRFSKKP